MKDPKLFDHHFIDAGENEAGFESDLDIKRAALLMQTKREAAGNSQFEVSWAQRGMPYAWSNTKQQVVELEANLRGMLETEKFGPKYLRDYFISLGYGNRQFTEVFARLTGVSFEDYMNVQGVVYDTPHTIPTINYGWGKAKGSEYEHYFVMPWVTGKWAVFGQKGDLVRDVVEEGYNMEECREQMEAKSSETHYWDKPVPASMLKGNEYPKTNLSEPASTFLTASKRSPKFASLDDWLYQNQTLAPEKQLKKLIIQAYQSKDINKEEFLELWAGYGFEKKADPDVKYLTPKGDPNIQQELTEQVFDLTDETAARPFEEEVKEVTPSEFFEQQKKTKRETVEADLLEKIGKYIIKKNESLSDFTLEIQSFKYVALEAMKQVEKTIDVMGQDMEDFFKAYAVISVVLNIVDNILPAPNNMQRGLMVFTIVENQIVAPDMIKGEDNKLYALTETGLANYFFKQRQEQQELPLAASLREGA